MKIRKTIQIIITFCLIVFIITCGENSSPNGNESWPQPTEDVNGSKSEIEGIPVLKVWGTSYEQDFQISTNHYRKRRGPVGCSRYSLLSEKLTQISRSESVYLTVEKAWELLQSVQSVNGITWNSAVFEPDKMLMHVAFAKNGKHAPECPKVTLDISQLLNETGN